MGTVHSPPRRRSRTASSTRSAPAMIRSDKVDDPESIYSVWLDPAVVKADNLDHKAIFDVHREATSKVIRKALLREPSID